jgi:hypothetical protein
MVSFSYNGGFGIMGISRDVGMSCGYRDAHSVVRYLGGVVETGNE